MERMASLGASPIPMRWTRHPAARAALVMAFSLPTCPSVTARIHWLVVGTFAVLPDGSGHVLESAEDVDCPEDDAGGFQPSLKAHGRFRF